MSINTSPTQEELLELWTKCQNFIEKQTISCPEAISQNDWVITNADDFIEEICNTVGYYDYPEDLDDDV